MADLSERMWNLVPQPQQTLYLQYYTAYGPQTWQGGELSWRVPTHKVI